MSKDIHIRIKTLLEKATDAELKKVKQEIESKIGKIDVEIRTDAEKIKNDIKVLESGIHKTVASHQKLTDETGKQITYIYKQVEGQEKLTLQRIKEVEVAKLTTDQVHKQYISQQKMLNVIRGIREQDARYLERKPMEGTLKELNSLEATIKKIDPKSKNFARNMREADLELKKIKTTVNSYKKEVEDASRYTTLFGQSVFEAGRKFTTWLIIGNVIVGFINQIKTGLQTLKEIDTELVNIAKVTDYTVKEMQQLTKTAVQIGQEFGRTPQEYLQSVTEFARAGFGKQAEEYGKLSLLLQNVGDVTAKVANETLIAANAGFQLGGSYEALMGIIDKFNHISNLNATNVEKLSDAMKVSASVFHSAGLSINETIALIGTATATTQRSGSEISRAFRTILMNIRQIKDGAMSEAEKALNSIGIVVRDTSNTFRPIFGILNDLGNSFKNLTQAQQAYVTEALAGKRQANVLISTLQNWDMVQKQLNESLDASGSALIENEIWMQSWEARVNQLSATITQFWVNLINTKVIKNLISFLNTVIKTFDVLINNSLSSFLIQAGLASGAIVLLIRAFDTLKLKIATTTVGMIATKVATHGFTAAVIMLGEAIKANPLLFCATVITTGLYAVIKAVDHFTVSIKEQKQKVAELTNEINSLQSEYDQLKVKDNRTEQEEAYLKLLEREIELKKESQLLESQSLVEKEFFTPKGFQGVEFSGTSGADEIERQIEKIEKLKEEQLKLNKNTEEHKRLNKEILVEHEKLISSKKDLMNYLAITNEIIKSGTINPILIEQIDLLKPKVEELIGKIDEATTFETFEEKKQQIDELTDSITSLSIELEQLKEKEDTTSYDEKKIKLLEEEIRKKQELKKETIKNTIEEEYSKKNQIKLIGNYINEIGKLKKELSSCTDLDEMDEITKKINDIASNLVPIYDNLLKYMDELGEESDKGLVDLAQALEYTLMSSDALSNETEELDNVLDKLYNTVLNTSNSIDSLTEAYVALNEGKKLSNKQIIELVKKYPQLQNEVKVMEGRLHLEKEAVYAVMEAEQTKYNVSLSILQNEANQLKASILNKVRLYGKEVESIQDVINARNALAREVESGLLYRAAKKLNLPEKALDFLGGSKIKALDRDIAQLKQIQKRISEIENWKGINFISSAISSASSKSAKSASSAAKSASSAAKSASSAAKSASKAAKEIQQYITDEVARKIDNLRLLIDQAEGKLSQLEETSESYRNILKEQMTYHKKLQDIYHKEAEGLRAKNKQIKQNTLLSKNWNSLTNEQKEKLNELNKELEENEKTINNYSSAWWDAQNAIDSATKAIEDSIQAVRDLVVEDLEIEKAFRLDALREKQEAIIKGFQDMLDPDVIFNFQDFQHAIKDIISELDLIDEKFLSGVSFVTDTSKARSDLNAYKNDIISLANQAERFAVMTSTSQSGLEDIIRRQINFANNLQSELQQINNIIAEKTRLYKEQEEALQQQIQSVSDEYDNQIELQEVVLENLKTQIELNKESLSPFQLLNYDQFLRNLEIILVDLDILDKNLPIDVKFIDNTDEVRNNIKKYREDIELLIKSAQNFVDTPINNINDLDSIVKTQIDYITNLGKEVEHLNQLIHEREILYKKEEEALQQQIQSVSDEYDNQIKLQEVVLENLKTQIELNKESLSPFQLLNYDQFLRNLEIILVDLDILDKNLPIDVKFIDNTDEVRNNIKKYREDIELLIKSAQNFVDTPINNINDLDSIVKTQIDYITNLGKEVEHLNQLIHEREILYKKEEEAIRENIKLVEENYNNQIELQEEKLKLLDEEISEEERRRRLLELNQELELVMRDKRFEYITKEGERVFTYDKTKVDELQKRQEELVKQYQREDLRRAIQDEIDYIRKARDEELRILNEKLEETRKIHNAELDSMRLYIETMEELRNSLITDVNDKMNKIIEIQQKEIDELQNFKSKELKLYNEKFEETRKIHNAELDSMRLYIKTMEELRNSLITDVNDKMNKIIEIQQKEIDELQNFKSKELELYNEKLEETRKIHNAELDSLRLYADSLEQIYGSVVSDCNNKLNKLQSLYEQHNKEVENYWDKNIEAVKNGTKEYEEILELWYKDSESNFKIYVDNIEEQYKRLQNIWSLMKGIGAAKSPSTSSSGSGGSSGSSSDSVKIDTWGHNYEISNGGHVITKNGKYVPAKDFKYLPKEVVDTAKKMKNAHTGGIIGEIINSKTDDKKADLINKLFKTKNNETIIKALKNEVIINPRIGMPNFISNMKNLASSIVPKSSEINNIRHYHFKDLTIKADNAMEFLDSIDLLVTTQG